MTSRYIYFGLCTIIYRVCLLSNKQAELRALEIQLNIYSIYIVLKISLFYKCILSMKESTFLNIFPVENNQKY